MAYSDVDFSRPKRPEGVRPSSFEGCKSWFLKNLYDFGMEEKERRGKTLFQNFTLPGSTNIAGWKMEPD